MPMILKRVFARCNHHHLRCMHSRQDPVALTQQCLSKRLWVLSQTLAGTGGAPITLDVRVRSTVGTCAYSPASDLCLRHGKQMFFHVTTNRLLLRLDWHVGTSRNGLGVPSMSRTTRSSLRVGEWSDRRGAYKLHICAV